MQPRGSKKKTSRGIFSLNNLHPKLNKLALTINLSTSFVVPFVEISKDHNRLRFNIMITPTSVDQWNSKLNYHFNPFLIPSNPKCRLYLVPSTIVALMSTNPNWLCYKNHDIIHAQHTRYLKNLKKLFEIPSNQPQKICHRPQSQLPPLLHH